MGPRSGWRPYYDSAGDGRAKQEEFGLVRLHQYSLDPGTLSNSKVRVALEGKWSWAKPPDSAWLRSGLPKMQESYKACQYFQPPCF
jgi:hypothetical protein